MCRLGYVRFFCALIVALLKVCLWFLRIAWLRNSVLNRIVCILLVRAVAVFWRFGFLYEPICGIVFLSVEKVCLFV